jgi:catechol 2,3-dioxygenase-like lactoylglutathione lyase family enzyme
MLPSPTPFEAGGIYTTVAADERQNTFWLRQRRRGGLGFDRFTARGNSMITGAHIILYSRDAEADRAFFRDVLGFDSVDAGHGWLIFALPPSEAAIHPAETNGRHQMYLLCDDLEATLAGLEAKNITAMSRSEERWGSIASLELPGGGTLAIYEPKHATAIPASR